MVILLDATLSSGSGTIRKSRDETAREHIYEPSLPCFARGEGLVIMQVSLRNMSRTRFLVGRLRV